jgi:hypothetical protein
MTWKTLGSLAVIFLVGVGCGSDDANNSDSQSATPSPTPAPRPVTATGEFICVAETTPTGCLSGLTAGTSTMELKFDLSGGPASGTATGETTESAPGCSWDSRTDVVIAGQFNQFGRTFTGTTEVTFTRTLTSGARGQCNPQTMQAVETSSRSDLFLQAQLQVDDSTIKGCLLDAVANCHAEFLLSIPLQSLEPTASG